ncbi:MAG: hypothetical protein V2A73_18275, partial [Pseudomonadota bacterium]
RPFIGVPCHRRAADCCGENSTSKEEWNKELGTRHREQHNQRLLFTPSRGSDQAVLGDRDLRVRRQPARRAGDCPCRSVGGGGANHLPES